MGKIWEFISGEESKGPADRVLERCGNRPGIGCWTSPPGALTVAVYLQRHEENGDPLAPDEALIRIAYRSYHPSPVKFRRAFECEGGQIDQYDQAKVVKTAVGRQPGQPSITARVPEEIGIKRGPNGSQLEAKISFVGKLQPSGGDRVSLSVLYPEGGAPCLCC
jgi:hypothetical protein